VLLQIGARPGGGSIVYPPSEVAGRHGAAVEHETTSPDEAYASFAPWRAIGESPL
jgi:hypothetical protein